jgi:hypothetical protein
MQPVPIPTRRASEGRWPRPVADAQPATSLVRRVGTGTAFGESIPFLTLEIATLCDARRANKTSGSCACSCDRQRSVGRRVFGPQRDFQAEGQELIPRARGPGRGQVESPLRRRSGQWMDGPACDLGDPYALMGVLSCTASVLALGARARGLPIASTRPGREGLPGRFECRGVGWCDGSGQAGRVGHTRGSGRGGAHRFVRGGEEAATAQGRVPSG